MAQSRIGLVLLTAGVTALITSALWIGVGAVAYWYFVDEPPPFVVKIDSPDTATNGEQINLVVEISNPTHEELDLGSIDIYDSLTDGFAIVAVDPPPDSRDDIYDFTTFYYARSLAPGASFEVNLALEARSIGVWTGDIDCCTPQEKFVTTSHTIVVTDSSRKTMTAEQVGAGQPATRSESDSEGGDKPQPEAEGRSRSGAPGL